MAINQTKLARPMVCVFMDTVLFCKISLLEIRILILFAQIGMVVLHPLMTQWKQKSSIASFMMVELAVLVSIGLVLMIAPLLDVKSTKLAVMLFMSAQMQLA